MAFRLNTGRSQQWSSACKNNLRTLHLGRSSVVRVRRSVKSSAHGRRWLTQVQLTRSEIFETS